ncbi:MAG: hypothetical protein IJO62_03310 [Clostridia bacterium]|nr:hypothetical protein [Clostridia bacterium]
MYILFDISASVIYAVAFAIISARIVILAVQALSTVFGYHINGLAINGGKITANSGGFTKVGCHYENLQFNIVFLPTPFFNF